ncbi:uncharacterized protein LOC119160036 isoform X2 [Rhipicephalus microplus]
MLCQLPGSNLKKSKQWKDFERDWNILMHHVFTKEEEELLANCCGPGQHEAVSTCVKGSNFTRKEYIQLRVSVVAWRHNKNQGAEAEEKEKIFNLLRRGKISMWALIKKLKGLMDCLETVQKAERNSNS